MYVKLKNNQIEVYPYYISNLYNENPDISFPDKPNNELLTSFDIYPVKPTVRPEVTYKQNLVESTPVLIDGQWTQVWEVQDKSQDEINSLNENLRSEAYKRESDPLFFKWQRGEIPKQQWLNKVNEIKTRYN